MIPKESPYAKYDYDDGCFECYCVTDDWDFGDYNATWHFHMLNLFPTFKFQQDDEQ